VSVDFFFIVVGGLAANVVAVCQSYCCTSVEYLLFALAMILGKSRAFVGGASPLISSVGVRIEKEHWLGLSRDALVDVLPFVFWVCE
jgi:hypothetical protein